MKYKGIYLALATALISGFAVFLNKFGATEFGEPFLYTTLKNVGVALIFFGIILLPKLWKEIKKLDKKQWLYLWTIGLIGGSVPFLMFFKGITMTSSANAGFIHKTLFIWVSILAFFFLKERLGKIQIFALILLFGGNFMLFGLSSWQFGVSDLLILGATLLWSAEYMFAKKLLKNLSSEVVAWGRMFLGSLILIGFVLATGRGEGMLSITFDQIKWLLVSVPLLFGFVFTWYKALKYAPASTVTCFLVPASLITTFLNSIFITHKYTIEQAGASIIFVVALVLFYKFRPKYHEKPDTVRELRI
ncbi:MAG: DMT family transporter [Parcubacteria group bacterium]|nr:DMT family transporter [Parcubacteria group bacterium]